MKVRNSISADWQDTGMNNSVAQALGLNSVLIGRSHTTYLRAWDEQGIEKKTDELEQAPSLYAAAVTIGKHNDAPYTDGERSLVLPNVKIHCEHIRGAEIQGGPPPLTVPAKFFVSGTVDGQQVEFRGFWNKKTQIFTVAVAALANGVVVGARAGVLAGTLVFSASVIAALPLAWGQISLMALHWGGWASAFGSVLGAGVGAVFQWRVSEMEKQRAEILDSLVSFNVATLERHDPKNLSRDFVDLVAKKSHFEGKFGQAEATPLDLAFAELRDEGDTRHVK